MNRARPALLRTSVCAYLVLQATGLAGLLAILGIVWLLRSQIGLRLPWFHSVWFSAFVLVPVSFVPALTWWHGWAVARYGRHPTTFRVVAEVSFALEIVGYLLFQGLA